MTYTSHLGISQPVFDLTFATSKIVENIVDWAINNDIVTKSDYEVIVFNVLTKNAQKVDSSLNASYNVEKIDWNNFIKNLQSNYASAKSKMQTLSQSSNIENMKNYYFIAFNDWKCNKWKYFEKTIV